MKTIITQKIDGYDIIVGLGDAQIDPIETEPVVNIELKKHALYKQADALKDEIGNVAMQGIQAKKNSRQATAPAEKKKYWDEFLLRQLQITDIGKNLKPIIDELINVKRGMIEKHAVYFTPKPGEEIVTPEFHDQAKSLLQNSNGFIDKNLAEICDNRGKTFWKKVSEAWLKDEVNKIGQSPKSGYLEITDLDEKQVSEIKAQIEKERLSTLKPEQVLNEQAQAIKSITSSALSLRLELEITKDPDALIKAQDYYETELAKIEVKYS